MQGYSMSRGLDTNEPLFFNKFYRKIWVDFLLDVARVVEIFKIWYFINYDVETVIYLKYWLVKIEKDYCRQQPL